ncbi:hypothetical protein Hanom_Chr15g01345771 [Helianthus anomalus]
MVETDTYITQINNFITFSNLFQDFGHINSIIFLNCVIRQQQELLKILISYHQYQILCPSCLFQSSHTLHISLSNPLVDLCYFSILKCPLPL